MGVLKASEHNLTISSHFSQEYKIYVFSTWYANGKPNAKNLQAMLEEPEPNSGKFPQPTTLKKWIDNEFIAQAIFLDEKVALELENRLTSEKIEMLSRHAGIAEKMQEEAWVWFENTKKTTEDGKEYLDLGNARTAITLLVEGLKIERESRGIAQISEKFSRLTDNQLVDRLKELVMDAPRIVTIEAVDVIDA